MAYLSYYQNSQPNWGTQQYQFIPPPTPRYQPQPSCEFFRRPGCCIFFNLSFHEGHGGDYYRAHSDSSDKHVSFYASVARPDSYLLAQYSTTSGQRSEISSVVQVSTGLRLTIGGKECMVALSVSLVLPIQTYSWVRLKVDPSKLLPREIGAAAGYETIRFWEHQKAIYFQPLSDDRDREREALIGLAAAEGTSSWWICLLCSLFNVLIC